MGMTHNTDQHWVSVHCSDAPTEDSSTDDSGNLATDQPTDDWVCPITHDYFYAPAILPSGRRYEFDAIVRWCGEHGTDPMTRAAVHLDRPPPIDLHLQERITRWRTATVQYHLSEVTHIRQTSNMSHDTLQQIRKHIDAALVADPRSAELHAMRIQYLETHGTEAELKTARDCAQLAESDEEARKLIMVNLEEWTQNLQAQRHAWIKAALRDVGRFVVRQPRTTVYGLWVAGAGQQFIRQHLIPRAAPL